MMVIVNDQAVLVSQLSWMVTLFSFTDGEAASHRVTRWDGQQHIHAGNNLPKDAVFSIQPGGGNVGDEELAAIGARTGIRH